MASKRKHPPSLCSMLLVLTISTRGAAFTPPAGIRHSMGYARPQPSNCPHYGSCERLADALPICRRRGCNSGHQIRRPRQGAQIVSRSNTGRNDPETSTGFRSSSASAGGIKVDRMIALSAGGSSEHDSSRAPSEKGGTMEVVCDQCGGTYCDDTRSSPTSPRIVAVGKPVAVCRAAGCEVAFSQCERCEGEYTGCCSEACQALAAEQVSVQTALPVETSGSKRWRRSGRCPPPLNGGDGDEFVVQDAAGAASSRKYVSSSALGAHARPPENDPMRADSRHEKTCTSLSAAARGVSSAGSAASRGGGKATRQMEMEACEPLTENYASRHSEPESPCLAGVREATNRAQPEGAHMLSGHLQGEVLKLLVKLSGAKRVLDIGTFTGYSALAFAEALPDDGVVVTLESDARAAETARGHFASSAHGGKIRLLLGQAMDGIDQLIAEDAPQFDVIFIDADKRRYWNYYEKVLAGPRPVLAKTGMLLADNVLFHCLVPSAEAMRTERVVVAQRANSNNNRGGEREDKGSDRKSRTVSREGNHQGVVGRGILASTPRRLKIAESLDAFNKRVLEDDRVEVLMLPLRDGLSVVTWRSGRYPSPVAGEE